MLKRFLLLLLINVAIFCAAAELLALGIFYFQHGWLFYLDPYRPTLEEIQDAPNQGLTAVGLHPYFGPTHRPGIPFDLPAELRTADPGPAVATNNFGFASRYDYPVARTNDRQFIIGIFGGSVGAFFLPGRLEPLRSRPEAERVVQEQGARHPLLQPRGL